MKDISKYSRKQLFALLKGSNGVLQSPDFGLYLEIVTGIDGPFNIERVFELYMGVKSCSSIETERLRDVLTNYLKWRLGDDLKATG